MTETIKQSCQTCKKSRKSQMSLQPFSHIIRSRIRLFTWHLLRIINDRFNKAYAALSMT